MTRRGRRLGQVSQAVLTMIRARALEQPMTLHEVAVTAQLSYSDAKRTVQKLNTGGWIRYGDQVPGRGNRPARELLPAEEPQQRAAELHAVMGLMIRSGR
jgi:MarR-like DNA-binding transcriptional regulator SgrR of sgrS sRNA